MNKIGILFLVVFIVTISSCSKKIILLGPAPDRSLSEVLEAIENHNIDWDWFAIKAGTKITSPDENVSGTAYLRMKKDSIIWVVAKKLGAEVTRNLITKDSIHILYRWEQIYERGTLDELRRKYKIQLAFEDMQQMMFGNVIIPDSMSSTLSKENEYLRLDAIDGDLFLSYWINPYDLRLAKVKISDHLKREITALFDDYRKEPSGHVIPFTRTYILPAKGDETAELQFEIKEIEINVPKKTVFEVPSHYEIY